ncbi:TPA: hypothetical protein QH957_002286 [Enterobacter bugandensis]|nr:hypothetical protein [Enterobacter bugandensis]
MADTPVISETDTLVDKFGPQMIPTEQAFSELIVLAAASRALFGWQGETFSPGPGLKIENGQPGLSIGQGLCFDNQALSLDLAEGGGLYINASGQVDIDARILDIFGAMSEAQRQEIADILMAAE